MLIKPKRLTILLLTITFFLLPLNLNAATEEDLLYSENLKLGKYDELIDEWLDYAKQNPNEAFTEVILRSIPTFTEYLKDKNKAIEKLKAIYEDSSINGFNKLILAKILIWLYDQQGNYESAKILTESIGCITDWAFIGPWGFTARSMFDKYFSPEEKIDFKTTINHERRELKWRILPKDLPYRPISFFNYLRPIIGTAYGLTQIKSPQTKEGYLIIDSLTAFKVWLNGQLIFEADRLRTHLPKEFIIPIKLNSGWNHLMIKTIAGKGLGQFQAQLLGKDWKPFGDLLYEKDLRLNESNLDIYAKTQTTPSPALNYYKNNKIILGLLSLYLEDFDNAHKYIQEALEKNPSSVFLQYYLSLVYEKSTLLPSDYAQNQSRQISERMLDVTPDFVPAYFSLAKYYEQQNKPEKALTALDKSLEINSSFLPAYFYGTTICNRKGWKHEADKYLKKASQITPENIDVLIYKANHYIRDKNYKKALELYKNIIKKNPSFLEKFISIKKETGNTKETIEGYKQLIMIFKNDPYLKEDLAKLFADTEDYNSALEQYKILCELIPDEADYPKYIGDIYIKLGQKEKALNYYKKSLKLRPYDITLKRQTEHLEGKDEDFGKEFYIDVKPLIQSSPTQKQYPYANIAYLVDQAIVRIYEDGSHSEIIHQAYKILNEVGIQKYSTVQIYDFGGSAELMEARTYRRNGQIMEPVIINKKELTMPGVEVGSVVEFKYRVDIKSPPLLQFNFPKFYFQDPAYDAPFLISELVFITPKNFPFKYIQGNFPARPKIIEKENNIIYTWTVTQTERLEPETMMPHSDVVLPYVMVGEKRRDWDDINQFYKEMYLERTSVTDLIKKQAFKTTEDKKTAVEKTQSLYYFVDNLIKNNSGELNAQSILINRYGSRLILLKSLLDAVGIENYFVLVRQPTTLMPEPKWDFPQSDYFTEEGSAGHLIMAIDEEKQPIWICGDYRNLIFGDLPQYVQGGRGIIVNNKETNFVDVPKIPIEKQSATTNLIFKLNPQSHRASLEGNITYLGLINAQKKNEFLVKDKKGQANSFEQDLAKDYPGLELKTIAFTNINQQSQPLQIKFTCDISGFISKAGEELKCSTGINPLNLTNKFIEESSRNFPLVIEEYLYDNTSSKIIIPNELIFVWIPKELSLSTSFGTYSMSIKKDKKSVTFQRIISIKPQEINPEEYQDFIKFCREIDYYENRPIRFSKQ